MKKRGRKKITCSLGKKRRRCVVCYDYEWQLLQIYFEKLKKDRPKFYLE